MVRKIILISSVLFGLIILTADGPSGDGPAQLGQAQAYMKDGQYEQAESIYRTIVADLPGTDYAFQAQKNLVIVYIAMDMQPEAQEALQYLLTEFPTLERLPHSVHEIAERCCQLGQAYVARQLYLDVLDAQPDSEQAIWLYMGVALSDTYFGDDPNAEAVTEALITDFYEDNRSAEAVAQIAWSCRKLKKYEKARKLYQYVADNWPFKDRAIFSIRGVARCNIALGNEKAAWAAAERLLSEFPEDEHLAEAVSSIAENYRKLGKYKEARILHQYVLDNCPESEQAIWSQRGVVLSNIGLGDDPNTEASIEALFDNFSDNKHIAKVAYQIARKTKDDEKAGVLYQYVVDNHPDSDIAILSLANIGNIYIRLGDFNDAQVILDNLLIDFSDHPILPKAVSVMGDGYYSEALRMNREGLEEQARWYYRKAVVECERILTQLPETPYTTAEACYFLAVCQEQLGEHADAIDHYQMVIDNWPDFQYTWHALFRVGCGYETLKQRGLMAKSEADANIKAVYQQLLETYPTCKVSRHARRWLSRHEPTNQGESR